MSGNKVRLLTQVLSLGIMLRYLVFAFYAALQKLMNISDVGGLEQDYCKLIHMSPHFRWKY